MRRLIRGRDIWLLVLLAIGGLGTPCVAGGETGRAAEHAAGAASARAVVVTPAGEMVLRDDGRVVGFRNMRNLGADPVFIAGLADIVDVAGEATAQGGDWENEVSWIALRRDGAVLQWTGRCASGANDCSYSKAAVVSGLRNIVAISSSNMTHLALDRDGQAWGWGGDGLGWITGRTEASRRSSASPFIEAPVKIPLPVPLKAVALGVPHATGIDRTGAVWIWGGADIPELLPEQAEIVRRGAFVARKVLGLPPARAAVAGDQTFVVSETDELWSWGLVSLYTRPPSFYGTRAPQRVDGLCRVRSVAANTVDVAAVCEDGSVHRMLLPGNYMPFDPKSCVSCRPRIEDGQWQLEPGVKDIAVLRMARIAGNFAIAMIDRSGAVFLSPFASNGQFLARPENIVGPVNINP